VHRNDLATSWCTTTPAIEFREFHKSVHSPFAKRLPINLPFSNPRSNAIVARAQSRTLAGAYQTRGKSVSGTSLHEDVVLGPTFLLDGAHQASPVICSAMDHQPILGDTEARQIISFEVYGAALTLKDDDGVQWPLVQYTTRPHQNDM
jgi:hypothetical protein